MSNMITDFCMQGAVVDAKEYTLGALCAPNSKPVLEKTMGVKFIWSEVKSLDGKKKTATIKTDS